MRVAVQGLWHLGSVTAACLAAAGHDVVGFDEDQAAVAGLSAGTPPIAEPGLPELVQAGIAGHHLSFTTDAPEAVTEAEVLWVTYDTPVDENDVADVGFVVDRIKATLPLLPKQCFVVVSSQLPVGSIAALEASANTIGRDDLGFACSPENLRLGKAIEVFAEPDRVVLGVRHAAGAEKFKRLMAPITANVLVMGVESAEMTKHAINSFLAMSVAFANEIATVCEIAGADADEVALGLKSESRIGPRAYLGPGAAFAGGTLARDISFLAARGRDAGADLALIPAVAISNDRHRNWAFNRLQSLLGPLAGRRVAILGLTYKPGTDTLRRSSSVELARALLAAGATVGAFDPAVAALPPDLALPIELAPSAAAAVAGADAVVIGTDWPEFRQLDWPQLLSTLARPVVVDANGWLKAALGGEANVTYASVGRLTRALVAEAGA